jgi:superfamily II DNA/RNA helicase
MKSILRRSQFPGLFPLVSVPFFKLHGHLSQEVRKQTWMAFKEATSAVMVCTDVGMGS